MTKNPANRNVGDHLKEGAKNIKTTYDALYNRKGVGEGVGGTVKNNIKVAATGKTGAGMPKASPATRAKVVGMGAASVTPLGPVAAFASGVAKSVKQTNAAKAAQNAPKPATNAAAAAPKTFLKLKTPATPATGGAAPAAAPKPRFTPATKPAAPAAKGPVMGAKTAPKKT